MRAKVSLIAVVVCLVAGTTACLPDNPYWAPNQPVHPQFVRNPLPEDWLLRQASCMVGMTWDNYVVVDALLNVNEGSLEEWYSYLLTEFPNRVASTADCWAAWFGHGPELTWWCGGDLHPWPPAPNWDPNDLNLAKGFRVNAVCTGPDTFGFPLIQ